MTNQVKDTQLTHSSNDREIEEDVEIIEIESVTKNKSENRDTDEDSSKEEGEGEEDSGDETKYVIGGNKRYVLFEDSIPVFHTADRKVLQSYIDEAVNRYTRPDKFNWMYRYHIERDNESNFLEISRQPRNFLIRHETLLCRVECIEIEEAVRA